MHIRHTASEKELDNETWPQKKKRGDVFDKI